MFFTLEKLKARLPEIVTASVRASQPIGGVMTCVAPGQVAESAMAAPPAANAPGWKPLNVGERWGARPGSDPNETPRMLDWGIPYEGGSTHWLRAKFRVPDEWRGKAVLLALQWQGEGQASVEAIVYLDGKALAGIDYFHRHVLLSESAHSGEHEVLWRCYVPYAQPFGGMSLKLRDEAVFQFGQAFRAALEAVVTYADSNPVRHALMNRINDAYNMLDLREGTQSQRFADSARTALGKLREGLSEGLERGQRPRIISTGHAHMDVAWLWPLWRTRQKIAHTVASALNLMERYPDYHFSMSQPQTYAFLQQDDPDLYARLKQRVAEGRFEPVGQMWLEPDCNIPSGESLVRQLTEGAKFFNKEFGELQHVVWLPDVFGYCAALPQLMRLSGIKSFMTTKISWNQFNRMPVDTFRWRGIDGSEVLTHFVTASDQPVKHPADAQFYTYVGRMSGGEAFGTWNHYRQKDVNDEILYIYGWGDGGGGPTEEMLEAANVFCDLPEYPEITLGRVDGFFERLYDRVWDNPQLPTWVGELYLEYHRGTYTSQGRTKKANRAAELLLRDAEWLNAWANLQGRENEQQLLNHAWRFTLLNQFHDILPGSSIWQVYEDSNAQHAEIQRIGNQVRKAAFNYLDERIGSTGAAAYVLNTLPWDRHDYAHIELHKDEQPLALANADGTTLLSQVVEEQPGVRTLLVESDAPSYGWRPLKSGGGKSSTNASALKVSRNSLENGELRLTLDDNGEISSLFDVRNNRESIALGKKANQLVIYEDKPLNWSAWDIDIFYEQKPYPIHDITDWRVVEEGPVRAAVEITRKIGKSTLRQRIAMWRDSRRVDFITEVDWQERETLLRALFPLKVNTARATCEIQFGAVERPTHRNTSWDWARFEVCAHRWVDLSEGDYGVALLNDGKYGHSLLDNVLGISLLKGATFPDPNADLGMHRFTYSLLPHAGDWREGQVVRRAYELNVPLYLVILRAASTGKGSADTYSFLSTPTDHIVVETVKVAENGDGLIVRLYEAHNQRGPASLVFGQPVKSAVEVDLLERETGAVKVEGNQISVDVRPYEVKTLRVRL